MYICISLFLYKQTYMHIYTYAHMFKATTMLQEQFLKERVAMNTIMEARIDIILYLSIYLSIYLSLYILSYIYIYI